MLAQSAAAISAKGTARRKTTGRKLTPRILTSNLDLREATNHNTRAKIPHAADHLCARLQRKRGLLTHFPNPGSSTTALAMCFAVFRLHGGWQSSEHRRLNVISGEESSG